MKFRWITGLLLMALALGAGGLTYFCLHNPMPVAAAGEDASLLWVRKGFNLSDEKMARIAQKHAAFRMVCDEHCRLIREARAEVGRLRAAKAEPAEIAEAEEKARKLDILCRTSLENHVDEISQIIGGLEARIYQSNVLPRIAHFEHTGAPNLDLDTNAKPHDHAHH